MTTTIRFTLGLLAFCLLTSSAYAQGLRGEWEFRVSYDEGRSGPAVVMLTPGDRTNARQVSLTLTDDRRDHELRLRAAGDGTFSGRADLPAMTAIRSLRLGTGGESDRNQTPMPRLQEARNGDLVGTREGDGWKITIVVE